jgi:protein-L-isoaspartate(D-aspartate) O-methyltransferase
MATNFGIAREKMVDCQVRTADVTQTGLLNAFREVPREMFMPDDRRALAYVDTHVDVATNRFALAPAALAKLLQAGAVGSGDIALDIGCGTGYSAGILSRICAFVVALECDRDLANFASRALVELEYDNTVVVEGSLSDGYPSEGPFDVIFLGGSVDQIPETLLQQLKIGGRLVAVVGQGNSALANIWLNDDGHISPRPQFNCAIPPLPGFARKHEFVF